MKTYLLYGAKDIRLSEKSVPIPGADQVLIKPKFTGICGSDVHYFQHGYCGNFIPKRPFALDPALLVTPPKGMEVGYVPIVTHQKAAFK